MNFHEVRFPTAISRGATGGPERRTDVVVLGSGHEERNSRWADSRRSYNAGYGITTLDDLHAVIAFFEERRGRLYGFRWKDHADFRSGPPSTAPTALDQPIGIGDGETAIFQLVKHYGSGHAPWSRRIAKPVAGTILIAVDGLPVHVGTAVTVDPTTGTLMFAPEHIPARGAVITAGFEFDVPVRFDADKLEVSLEGLGRGAIPSIQIVEIRL
ncbi:MAG: TIGR02217 family protein [Hyphomicrobiaceae bacterium]